MRIHALLLAMLVSTAGLAGCLGSGDDAGTETASADEDVGATQAETNETASETANETETTEDPGPQIEAHWYNATLQGGQAGPYAYCAPGCENGFQFPVENGSTGIVVEASWEKEGEVTTYVYPPCDSDEPLFLMQDCPDSASDTSGSPLRIQILDQRTEIEGDWAVSLFPQDSYTEQTEVTVVASVFYDEEPPRRFTKLDATAGT